MTKFTTPITIRISKVCPNTVNIICVAFTIPYFSIKRYFTTRINVYTTVVFSIWRRAERGIE